MGIRSVLNLCRFKNCVDGVVWVFTSVYGLVCSGDREEFWRKLGFYEEISEVLEKLELRDYPLRGGHSPRPVSDHFPILLEGGGLKRGPSPFRFENMWLEEEGFKDKMKTWWGSLNLLELYQEEEGWCPSVDRIPFMRLDNSEAEGLEIPFLEEEVLAALTDLGKDKAPGLDGFTMAFWLFEWDVIEKQSRGVMCKLDIEKAYDQVGWKFLLAMLKQMGFGERWIKWIEWCISTVRYFVLINGSPSGFFQSSRGLRQGDPLSPYPFVIAMEVISCLMRRAISGGFLSRWKARGRGGEGILISHLLFADDTLVFCEESQDQLTYLSWLLMWFEACSGLKVNLEKSELIPVGEVVWDSVEERFRKRLAMWKRQYISKGGRLTLIRSTLSSLPVYFMSLFLLPRKVRMRLEKIQRDFLWGGGALDQRPHLVRWNLVCLERKKGGLGVRNLALMNKALLERSGWGMYSSLAFRVSNGRRVRFWKDKWCGDEPLYESFPSLFSISGLKMPGYRKCGTQMVVQRENEDKMVWTASRSGVFSVKSLYSTLEPGGSALFPYVGIWRACVPPKVAFFTWEASWGKILTLDQLQRRGYSLANRCFLCLAEAETVDHLLLHCVMTRALWNLLFSLFGVERVLSGTTLSQVVFDRLDDESYMFERRPQLLHRLQVLLGGRAAEEVIYGRDTSRASVDYLADASWLARKILTIWNLENPMVIHGEPPPWRKKVKFVGPRLDFEGSLYDDYGLIEPPVNFNLDDQVAQRTEELISDMYGKTLTLLRRHHAALLKTVKVANDDNCSNCNVGCWNLELVTSALGGGGGNNTWLVVVSWGNGVLVEQKEISGEEIDFILNSYPPQTPVSCLLEEENPGSLPFGRQEHGLKLEDALLTPSKGFL
ncbi:putative inactive ATP-dependent zinc metalloprotease FTSHI 1, chloroplastic [Vitis vinifera]|uniref:Putative inactive ATP-dependent zinc metalloprotease FTSHI 1, chloroplastic n=1 Tax=Vitis vinifera TaxID=29760 RepID=A0A438BWY0_VITVI|nr:putative inactive ATP-dependent zinc metalloprotease FTSHI 1, chloroplastic [Vitis vinifera]